MGSLRSLLLLITILSGLAPATGIGQIAVLGETVHTMAGDPIQNGVVLVNDGKIVAVGLADEVRIPSGYRVIKAAVVTPGLIDTHSVVGLAGMLNQDEDQDQLESSSPTQPGLRALDAYNSKDELIDWIRSFGVTTVHTGHAPGELISGQTMIVKTAGNSVEDALISSTHAVAATLTSSARKSDSSAPGTRGKMMAMLREQFIKADEYRAKLASAEDGEAPPRDLQLEALVAVLEGEVPLLLTADRAQDIANALRLKEEFDINLILDSAAESYLLVDEIKSAGVPVVIHPSMARPTGDRENLGFETAAKLVDAGILVTMQSGYESYVPKTRVVLYEAALTAANGLSFQQALALITSDAARMLGIDNRVGTLEVGKDGDLAMYDGDPFEYTTHCVGTIIDGVVVSDVVR